jgi:hypothetical protein
VLRVARDRPKRAWTPRKVEEPNHDGSGASVSRAELDCGPRKPATLFEFSVKAISCRMVDLELRLQPAQ